LSLHIGVRFQHSCQGGSVRRCVGAASFGGLVVVVVVWLGYELGCRSSFNSFVAWSAGSLVNELSYLFVSSYSYDVIVMLLCLWFVEVLYYYK